MMNEVYTTLSSIEHAQQLLLLAFLTSYALSLGRLLEPWLRGRVALFALAAAVGFVALTDPWVHGALLMVLVVGVIGLLIGAVAVLDRAAVRAAAESSLPTSSAIEEVAVRAPAAGISDAAPSSGLRAQPLGVTTGSST